MYNIMYVITAMVLFVALMSPGQQHAHAQHNAEAGELTPLAVVHTGEQAGQRAPQSAETSERQEMQRSREIVEEGLHVAMDGSLRKMGERWFLAAEHTLHELLFGLDSHIEETGISLESGKEIRLTGFYHAPDDDPAGTIVVNSVVMDGQTYRFREEDGTPLWRGRGRGTGTGSRERTP